MALEEVTRDELLAVMESGNVSPAIENSLDSPRHNLQRWEGI